MDVFFVEFKTGSIFQAGVTILLHEGSVIEATNWLRKIAGFKRKIIIISITKITNL